MGMSQIWMVTDMTWREVTFMNKLLMSPSQLWTKSLKVRLGRHFFLNLFKLSNTKVKERTSFYSSHFISIVMTIENEMNGMDEN